MIVIDTSALVAILLKEPEAEEFSKIILRDDQPLISAASLVELYRVMKSKRGTQSKDLIDQIMEVFEISVVAVSTEQALLACQATFQYPILNYGDTFSYALAKDRDIPLLYKGNDFSMTDVVVLGHSWKNR